MAGAEMDGKKRTVKACDRCRLKKVRCDGSTPCSRCRQDNSICQFNVRSSSEGKSVSAGHVNQLQAQHDILVRTLKAVWLKYAVPRLDDDSAKDWSIHDIVRHSGVLKESIFQQMAASQLNYAGDGFVASPSAALEGLEAMGVTSTKNTFDFVQRADRMTGDDYHYTGGAMSMYMSNGHDTGSANQASAGWAFDGAHFDAANFGQRDYDRSMTTNTFYYSQAPGQDGRITMVSDGTTDGSRDPGTKLQSSPSQRPEFPQASRMPGSQRSYHSESYSHSVDPSDTTYTDYRYQS